MQTSLGRVLPPKRVSGCPAARDREHHGSARPLAYDGAPMPPVDPTPSLGGDPRRTIADPDAPGQRVELVRGTTVGRYVVVASVGSGGMGEVVRAYDPRLRREVAIKRLHRGALDADAEARLLREAQAMAKLSHPNVVAVYDVDRTELGVVLTMELVDGITLGDWLAEPRALREILGVFVEAGRALQAAHAAGIVHRDFKPGNVMIGRDGRVRVMDFGLARPVDDPSESAERSLRSGDGDLDIDISDSRSPQLTEHGAVVGTPAYMAPEQHMGESADARSDQYAFCVALWEAIYGTLPFRGTLAKLALAKADGPPQQPKNKAPRWIHDVIARGLAPGPEDRFSSMAELITALDRDPERKRRRIVFGALGGVALVAIGAVSVRGNQAASACPDPSAELSGVWDSDVRARIDAAIRARPLPYAATAATRVTERLDAYAAEWVEMKRDACRATHVRGEQSEDMLDRRTACLQRRRQQLAALADVLGQADDSTVERSVGLLAGLLPIEPCGDLERLRQAVAPPDHPEVAAAVEKVRGQLVEASALADAGHYDDALAVVDPLVQEADAIEYAPIGAEAHLQRGRIQNLRASYAAAETDFVAAYRVGLGAGADVVAVEAATALAVTVGMHLVRPDAGATWVTAAMALSQRVDPGGRWEADAHNARGTLAFRESRYAEAEADFRKAIELIETTRGEDDPSLASCLNHLGATLDEQGRYTEAEKEFRRALTLAEAAYGDEHPMVGNFLGNLAVNLSLQRKGDDALAILRRVIAIRERSLGPDHPSTALTHANLGWTVLERGEIEEAADHFERAMAAFGKTLGEKHPQVAMAAEGLATVEQKRGQFVQSEALHRRALEIRAAALGAEHPNVASSHLGLAALAFEQQRWDDALKEADLALAILDTPANAGHRFLADALDRRGRTLLALKRPEEAKAALQRSLEISGASRDPVEMSRTRIGLARAIVEAKGDVADARPHAERAQEALHGLDGAPPELVAEVDTWLAEHPAG
jgi:tetratricopeptide (TPR) repeat protein